MKGDAVYLRQLRLLVSTQHFPLPFAHSCRARSPALGAVRILRETKVASCVGVDNKKLFGHHLASRKPTIRLSDRNQSTMSGSSMALTSPRASWLAIRVAITREERFIRQCFHLYAEVKRLMVSKSSSEVSSCERRRRNSVTISLLFNIALARSYTSSAVVLTPTCPREPFGELRTRSAIYACASVERKSSRSPAARRRANPVAIQRSVKRRSLNFPTCLSR